MKAIMISIKPKWLLAILGGVKKIEVRKGTKLYTAITKLIEEYGEATFYTYCTKDVFEYSRIDDENWALAKNLHKNNFWKNNIINGKVVAKFICKKVEKIGFIYDLELCKNSCLDSDDLFEYLGLEQGTAIHISNLEIFDKPKELSEFGKWNSPRFPYFLTKAPQSWCYVEE